MRKNDPSAVLHYTWGTATLRVPFPDGGESCHFCPYLRYDDGCRRNYCGLTREYLVDPYAGRGMNCPVKFDKESEE